jgi:hypothetical protein
VGDSAIGLSPVFTGSRAVFISILGLAPQALCLRLLRRLRAFVNVQAQLNILASLFACSRS